MTTRRRLERPRRLALAATVMLAIGATACVRPTSAGRLTVVLHPTIVAHAPAVTGPALRGAIESAGRPVAGATVDVSVALSGAEQAGRSAKAASSFGLGCLDREGCTAPTTQGVTARDGTYAVAVPQGGAPADHLELTAVVARSTSRVATSVDLPATAHHGRSLPTIDLPIGQPHLTGSATHQAMQPPPLSTAVLTAPTVVLSPVARLDPGQQPVLTGATTDVSAGFDPRLLENEDALFESTQAGHLGALPAVVSSSLLVRGSSIPPSRGAACAITGSQGQSIAQHPCGLTDGILDTAWTPTDDPRCANGPCPGTVEHDQRDVVVTFAQPIPATLIVVRGCGFTCHISVTDALGTQTLPPPTQDSPEAIYQQTLVGLPITSVHIVTSTGGFFDALREVSVF